MAQNSLSTPGITLNFEFLIKCPTKFKLLFKTSKNPGKFPYHQVMVKVKNTKKMKKSTLAKKKEKGKKNTLTQTDFTNGPLTWFKRISMFNEVAHALQMYDNGESVCVNKMRLGSSILMHSTFGTPSKFGEAWTATTIPDNLKISVKKIPLLEEDKTVIFNNEQLRSGFSVWIEIVAFFLCNVFVLSKICPNFPLMYKYLWCKKCHFVNKKMGLKKDTPCLIVANELANGDLKMYLKQKLHIWNDALIKNCIFQVVAGLYALEKYLKMTHNDLHYGNVLVHECQSGGFWEYKIDNVIYHVPNLGYVFEIWDFGMCNIPFKLKGRPEFYSDVINPIPTESDIGRLSSTMIEVFDKTPLKNNALLKDMAKYESVISLPQILDTYFFSYIANKKLNDTEIIDAYNMDISVDHFLNSLPDAVREAIV